MKKPQSARKKCPEGHVYYKSTDCPTCPRCEAARRPLQGFLSTLVAPARRALESAGIRSLAALARHTETEILQLHGMGPSSLPKLRKALEQDGRSFRSA